MKKTGNGRARAWIVPMMLAVVVGLAAMGGAAERDSGQPEGIKVHGHWTIEIRNPDGSLASRHEIENALAGGQTLLAGLLGNHYVDPAWAIRLWVNPPSCGAFPPDPYCEIGPPALTVTLPLSSDNSPVGTLELSGSVTLAQNGSVWNVNTVWTALIRGTTNRAFGEFSGRGINVFVRQGQIIQVKVVFSFS